MVARFMEFAVRYHEKLGDSFGSLLILIKMSGSSASD
jgi:hypothetical protein